MLQGERRLVVLAGECDLTRRAGVREALREAGAGAPAEVVVDLAAVTFLDAGTVDLLVQAWQAAADEGGRLRVVGATGVVRRVFMACGVWEQLTGSAADPVVVSARPATRPDRRGDATGAGRRWALAEGLRARTQHARVMAEQQQLLIDIEIRATRRLVLAGVRRQLRDDPQTLVRADFLIVADRPVVLDAILIAAGVSDANAYELQTYEPATRSLRLVGQHGLSAEFLDYFAHADATCPSACATALATREPVVVDDITHSAIFAGQPSLPVMLAAGSRAVQSFPLLHPTGKVLAVLSFYYPGRLPLSPTPHLVAQAGAAALSELAGA